MATLTVFPNAGDGSAFNEEGTGNWATCHDAADSSSFLNTGANGYIEASFQTSTFAKVGRFFQNFDTSALGSSATVSAVTSNVYGDLKETGNGQTHNFNVFGSTSTDPPGTADFDQGGTTAFANTPIERAAWSTTGYNSWAWNATGIAAVSLTGLTKVCYRDESFDVPDTEPASSATRSYVTGQTSDAAGTTKDPYLEITYTAGGAVSPSTIARRAFGGGVSIGPALGF